MDSRAEAAMSGTPKAKIIELAKKVRSKTFIKLFPDGLADLTAVERPGLHVVASWKMLRF